MLFSLVKKDFILLKKYLLFLIAVAIGEPIFIMTKQNFSGAGFFSFFITVLFLEYMLFSMVSMSEEKYKVSVLLCSTPYTRNILVRAKYLSILVTFILAYIIYTVTAFVAPIGMEKLNIFTLGMSLLIITIFFGVIIPLQYKFGYEKTRYISFAIIFISPFIVPNIIKWLHSNNINLQSTIQFPQVIQNLFPCFLALIIGYLSMVN